MLRYHDGEALDVFHDCSTADGITEKDNKKYGRVKKAFLERFAKVKDPQNPARKAIEAGLLSKDLPGSFQRPDRLCANAEFSEKAKFRLLRAAVTIFLELAHFAIHRDVKDSLSLKKAAENY